MSIFSKKNLIIFSLLFVFCCLSLISRVVLAEEEPDLNLPNPLKTDDPVVVITRIVKYVLGLVGLIAVIMIIYGGFVWMTSGGNTEKIKKGKDTVVWAILGLALVFFAYAIINFILKIFVSTGSGGTGGG